MPGTRLVSLTQACDELQKLDLARATVAGDWTVGQVLVHCAQSIEYSFVGFPKPKPWLFRATIGKLALQKFLRQGFMRHDLSAQIPGAPPPEPLAVPAALERLLEAIDEFRARDRFAAHFAYGRVDKARYERAQAMHIADHLSSFSFAVAA